MEVTERLKDYLNKKNVDYTLYYHNPTDEKHELLKSLGLPGKEFVQTIIAQTEDGFVMVVNPFGQEVDLGLFTNSCSKTEVKLAKLDEIKALFPDCELGAIPPLGNLYKVPVYVSPALSNFSDIIFHAGTHTDTIKMNYEDFRKIVKPKINNCSKPVH